MELSAKDMQRASHAGYSRLKNFRKARVMFLRNFVGPYYDQSNGEIGQEALNLIFSAIRALVPNLVMNFPKHEVVSKYLAGQEYAELLSLALEQHDREIKIPSVYRRAIVDAIFTLGTVKTGLIESDNVLAIGDHRIDPGRVFTGVVDFDNLVIDPACREHMFEDAAFIGDRMLVPRSTLLESGLYNNALIERLPSYAEANRKRDKASDLSMTEVKSGDDQDFYDNVEITELWVPGSNTIVTVPSASDVTYEDYLRVSEYYGPKEGPYSFLSLTPPVPGNPLPVPMVGIWNDLHILANRMAKKIAEQADRQKDVVVYKRSAADDAQEMMEAIDGDAIATDSPDEVSVKSFGGSNNKNDIHLAQLQSWFSQMASNPEALQGTGSNAGSATEARILASNASVGLRDMKDAVYVFGAEEARKRAWYFHTDPFMEMPLTKRIQIPQPPIDVGGVMVPGGTIAETVQVVLTPEARSGDWLDFNFSFEVDSMDAKDSNQRFAEAMDFAAKIMPSAIQAAQGMALLGQPFNVREYILQMAKDRGIDWMDKVFYDPEFQQRMMLRMMMGPQMEQSKGQPGDNAAALAQNGQVGQAGAGAVSPQKQDNQQSQLGANLMQQVLRAGGQQGGFDAAV